MFFTFFVGDFSDLCGTNISRGAVTTGSYPPCMMVSSEVVKLNDSPVLKHDNTTLVLLDRWGTNPRDVKPNLRAGGVVFSFVPVTNWDS